MRASILAVGDEIVGGLTTDTNSGFLAQLLRSVGVEVTGILAIADDEPSILTALGRALEDADLVITTGGLGPTVDDLTTTCVAHLAGAPLELHEPSLRAIEERFRTRGIEMPENNRKQAMLPRGCEPIPNPDGTAPGFVLTLGGAGDPHTLVSLPGVPREMRQMAEGWLLPWIAGRTQGARIAVRIFSTFGLSESKLDELLRGVVPAGEARLSFRAAFPRLQARVSVMGRDEDDLEAKLSALEGRVRERLGDHLYAVGDEGLEETVGRLLRERAMTLALAESCTGGLIGHRITDVAGSSDYFLLGVVAYSNEMKQALLGVNARTLEEFGAVSEPTTREMARGGRAASGASFGLATSGIAGPGGASPDKPVGTVCIALAWEGGEWSRRYQLAPRSRSWIKELTTQLALDQLRRHLMG